MEFEQAVRLAAADAGKGGIGSMREKSLHLVLKYYFAPDRETHEIPVGGYVADARTADGIIEIQTRSLARLKPKLDVFLREEPVTVVYPIAANTVLCRVDENGELLSRRKSPKHETVYSAMDEIYALRAYLHHERFHLRVVSLEMNGYILDGAKKRERRLDREPTLLNQIFVLDSPADFLALLPDLPEEFSAKQLADAVHVQVETARRYINILNELGCAECCKRENRAKIWRILR